MKSFPSTLNESQNMYGSTKSQTYSDVFDIERLKQGALNLNKSVPVVQEMLKQDNINISNFQGYPYGTVVTHPNEFIEDTKKIFNSEGNFNNNYEQIYNEKVYFENPLELPSDIIALAKDYDWVYKYRVKALASVGDKDGDSLKVKITNTAIAPSMFNPMYGVSVLGITRNTPLLNDITDVKAIDGKISDCSIRTLCALSKNANSPLGQARYKYADFMYCKDLGKVANNHLITLRKFAHPVGDHIFEMTSPKYIHAAGDYSFQSEGDIGRLISWFGTDDNKLEDICKYSYHATWKELNAQIEEKESTADDESSGIIGMISKSLNPVYNKSVGAGQAGQHSIWGWLGSQLTDKVFEGIGKNNGLLRNYDNNKVYTPKNTVQSTNIYEGKLEFAQEFTLNFSYQLRAYDNINPRSALLDLIGNILEVTYRRGKFWGGSRKIIGPPQDMAPFDKTSAFIDNAFDKLGGFFNSLQNGGINWENILGAIGSMWNNGVAQIMNMSNGNAQGMASELASYAKTIFSKSGAAEAAKGFIKNALGRPTLYAWQSLLSGDEVGLWHVTIGNPRNPILAMGNLILTNAQITHSGPLGVDDFPTELKLSVTLKHARPRDVTEIGRMYTKGASAIYHVMAHHDLQDFFGDKEYSSQGNTIDVSKKTNPDASKGVHANMSKSASKSYKKEVNQYAGNKYKYSVYPDLDNAFVSNPFLETDEHVHIVRTNNFSDTMFSMSMQEAA